MSGCVIPKLGVCECCSRANFKLDLLVYMVRELGCGQGAGQIEAACPRGAPAAGQEHLGLEQLEEAAAPDILQPQGQLFPLPTRVCFQIHS